MFHIQCYHLESELTSQVLSVCPGDYTRWPKWAFIFHFNLYSINMRLDSFRVRGFSVQMFLKSLFFNSYCWFKKIFFLLAWLTARIGGKKLLLHFAQNSEAPCPCSLPTPSQLQDGRELKGTQRHLVASDAERRLSWTEATRPSTFPPQDFLIYLFAFYSPFGSTHPRSQVVRFYGTCSTLPQQEKINPAAFWQGGRAITHALGLLLNSS